jgi:hypothetical protein
MILLSLHTTQNELPKPDKQSKRASTRGYYYGWQWPLGQATG